MVKLTPEQESHIGDDVYHEKKIEEDIAKEKSFKITGKIPIRHETFLQIKRNVGRMKLGKNTNTKKYGGP